MSYRIYLCDNYGRQLSPNYMWAYDSQQIVWDEYFHGTDPYQMFNTIPNEWVRERADLMFKAITFGPKISHSEEFENELAAVRVLVSQIFQKTFGVGLGSYWRVEVLK